LGPCVPGGGGRGVLSLSGQSSMSSPTCLAAVKGKSRGGSSEEGKSNSRRAGNRQRSRVADPDGPTPDAGPLEVEELDREPLLEDIMRSEDLPRPIPHQPWRRGDTAGCEAPISAPWRAQAERIIETAVQLVGGKVLDVTWYLTQLVVTLDEEMVPPLDLLKSSGPPIDIIQKSNPMYYDPNDPDPEDIVGGGEDEVVSELSTAEEMRDEAQRRKMMYATKDGDDPLDESHVPDHEGKDPPVPLFVNQLTRDQVALQQHEDAVSAYEQEEKPMDIETIRIDTAALSTIAKAILDALEPYEDELQILARHELILTSPGSTDVLETQRQFDAFRGFDVIVETQDPFESNRVLKGRLVDRNSMDLIINKRGRKVTIPLNFVKCVRLPPAKREAGVPRDAPF
jgi:ribosome maturation factor RimP